MRPKNRKNNKRKMKKRRENDKLPAQDNVEFTEMHKINLALRRDDFALLREIGREQGFISDAVRRRVWPALLHSINPKDEIYIQGSLEVPHKDESQVKLDVNRSFGTFPSYLLEEEKKKLQDRLYRVIVHVLRSYPSLNYYQGFHDICSVFLLLFGEQYASRMMETVALFYLRDAMFTSLEPVLRELTTIDTLIRLKDPELHNFISESAVLPYYCLSWVITWCSHDLNNLKQITRLFDLFLCSNPFMVIYFSAAVVISRRNEILELPCEMSTVHSFLTKLPQDLDLDELIKNAIEIEKEYSAFEVQCQSTIALDTTSVVNRFEKDYLPITSLDELNKTIEMSIVPILKEKAEDKKPIELVKSDEMKKHGKQSRSVLQRLLLLNKKEATVYTLFAIGAGVGLLSVIMSNSDLAREWVVSLQ